MRAWHGGMLAVSATLLAGCGFLPFGASSTSPSPSPTDTMPSAACPAGDSVTPPDISDLTVDGVPAEQRTAPLVVPYNGLQGGSPERPMVMRLEVVTSASGSPVRFRATGALLLESLVEDPLGEPEVTVFSESGVERCIASVYLFATTVGDANVYVEGLNSTTTLIPVVTAGQAARNISLTVTDSSVDSGESFEALVGVTDVFGNPIENAAVDLSLPPKGPGRFVTGANTFTVLTDPKGRASVEIQTRKGGSLTVTAKGDLAACSPAENQYECPADRPVPGFEPASGTQKVKVSIVEPTVEVTTPPAGAAFSTGEKFDVAGKATGVREGSTVALIVGDTPLGASTVKADGTFTFRDVVAQKGGSGDLGYVVKVADLKPTPLDITVKDFTIVSYKRVAAGLRFRVAAGAWKAGTIIELTRDGTPVSKIEVTSAGSEVILFAPDEPGFYQVQVSTSRGIVYGLEVQPVL
ncbi:MAG: hypothetical protein RL134_412 [Actinomycetota bacterium]